jgi:anti-anti-sigma factor
MAAELVKDGPEWILRLSGEVVVAEMGNLHAAAQEADRGAPRAVVIDLRNVDNLDTAATQVLLGLQKALTASGRTLRFEDTPSAVAEGWTLARLTSLTAAAARGT